MFTLKGIIRFKRMTTMFVYNNQWGFWDFQFGGQCGGHGFGFGGIQSEQQLQVSYYKPYYASLWF